jgi:hypothetical protein
MDDATSTSSFDTFTSPWRNLAWCFRKSRDSWKKKYRDLKREQKRLQNQLRDVRKSREHWRQVAEQGQQIQAASPPVAGEPSPPTVPLTAGEKKG